MSTYPKPPTKHERREAARAARLEAEQADAAAARRRKRLTLLLAVLGAAAVVVVIAVLVSSGGGNKAQNRPAAAQKASTAGAIPGQKESGEMLAGIPQQNIYLGKPNAPVRLVEFADLQCPFCREYTLQTLPTLVQDYVRTGKVRMEFRNLSFIGDDSVTAGRAAAAAGQQDKLWNFIDVFYFNQGEENSGYVTDAFLTSIAKGAGVKDLDKWNSDRSDNSKWDPLLSKNDSDAKSLGFSGTPSILVEGPGGKKPFTTIPTVAQIQAAVKSVS
jgi:protein-disulfide isomerase